MSNRKTYFLRNMVCSCCITLLRERLEKTGFIVTEIRLGEVTVESNHPDLSDEKAVSLFNDLGFEVIRDKNIHLVEQIKIAVIELIHELNNVNSIIRKSDYLVEKLGMSYQQLSKTFSQHEPVTLEKFIILHKIEKIKELIDSGEYTLSEIAWMMDYSSVQHLSSQFKQITGLTPSDYKKSDHSVRKSLESLY
jgi:AraC family transcriptional regulator